MTDFYIFRSNNVYVSVADGRTIRHWNGLEHLGCQLIQEMVATGEENDDDDDATFFLSAALNATFSRCAICRGEGRVEAPGTSAGQFVTSDFDAIDFNRAGTRICAECRGMGVTVPGFFEE